MTPRDVALSLLSIVLVLGGTAYGGYMYAAKTYGAEIERIQRQHAEESAARSEAVEQQLREKDRINDRLTAEAVEGRRALAAEREQLERKINDAIAHDGPVYGGLGPNGVWLYRRALGYPDDAPGGVGSDTSQTGPAVER